MTVSPPQSGMRKHRARPISYPVLLDDDDDDKELMALEAEKVRDDDGLPGEKPNSRLSAAERFTRPLTPLPPGKLAPVPSNEALFGECDQDSSKAFVVAFSLFRKHRRAEKAARDRTARTAEAVGRSSSPDGPGTAGETTATPIEETKAEIHIG